MMIDTWTDFFAAQVVGSSALLGLLFVSISLNLEKMLAEPMLPDRALIAMVLMLGIILSSSLALMPGQTTFSFGLTVLVLGLTVAGLGANFERGIFRSTSAQRETAAINTVFFSAAVLPQIVGGLILLSGSAGGFYWVAAGILISLTKAVLDAWVLLVEINR